MPRTEFGPAGQWDDADHDKPEREDEDTRGDRFYQDAVDRDILRSARACALRFRHIVPCDDAGVPPPSDEPRGEC